MTADDADRFLDRWWREVWQDGNVNVIEDLFVDGYVQHSSRGNVRLSHKEFKTRMVQYQRVLHGASTTVDDRIVSGDTLWMRATSRGVNLETNGGSLVTWMICYRFEGDRVAEGWVASVPDVDWHGPVDSR